jgi:hypothetical protein
MHRYDVIIHDRRNGYHMVVFYPTLALHVVEIIGSLISQLSTNQEDVHQIENNPASEVREEQGY